MNYSFYFCNVPRRYKTDVIWSYLIFLAQGTVYVIDITFILRCLLDKLHPCAFNTEEEIREYAKCSGHCNLSNIHFFTNCYSLCFFMCVIKAMCDNKHTDMCLCCVHLSGTKAIHSLPPDPRMMTVSRCSSALGDPLAIIKNREEEPKALNEYISVQVFSLTIMSE